MHTCHTAKNMKNTRYIAKFKVREWMDEIKNLNLTLKQSQINAPGNKNIFQMQSPNHIITIDFTESTMQVLNTVSNSPLIAQPLRTPQ
jgi:hypothetical protein